MSRPVEARVYDGDYPYRTKKVLLALGHGLLARSNSYVTLDTWRSLNTRNSPSRLRVLHISRKFDTFPRIRVGFV